MMMIISPLLLRDDRLVKSSQHVKTTFKFVEPSGPCFNLRIAELWGKKEMTRQSLVKAMEEKIVDLQKEEDSKSYSFFW
jgi:hypothetical protein